MSCVIKTQVANGDADLNLVSLFFLDNSTRRVRVQRCGMACMMEFLTYLSVTTLDECVIELRIHFDFDMVIGTHALPIHFFPLKKD